MPIIFCIIGGIILSTIIMSVRDKIDNDDMDNQP